MRGSVLSWVFKEVANMWSPEKLDREIAIQRRIGERRRKKRTQSERLLRRRKANNKRQARYRKAHPERFRAYQRRYDQARRGLAELTHALWHVEFLADAPKLELEALLGVIHEKAKPVNDF
jgi:hypothetical protein